MAIFKKILRFIYDLRKEFLLSITTTVLLLLLLGGGLEIYFRLIRASELNRLSEKLGSKAACYQVSEIPGLIYQLMPGHCNTNSQGFTDKERSLIKPPKTRRIALIGDSVAEGVVGDPKTQPFGKLLETWLNEADSSWNYEVIILAVRGYSTVQELLILDQVAPQYDPDLILWNYVLNDPAHPVYHAANNEVGALFYRPTSYAMYFLQGRFFRAMERAAKVNCIDEYHEMLHCVYWDQVEKNLKQIASLTHQQNTPVLFSLTPAIKPEGFDPYPLADLHRRIMEASQQAGLRSIDLAEAFKGHSAKEVGIYSLAGDLDPWHPNPKGHQIIAEAIFPLIKEHFSPRKKPKKS